MIRAAQLLLFLLLLGCRAEEEPPRLPLSERAEAGRTVFLEKSRPPCGKCHRLRDARTDGMLGSDLDQVQPSKERVLRVVQRGIGLMRPQSDKLTDGEIEDLALYVAEVAGQTEINAQEKASSE